MNDDIDRFIATAPGDALRLAIKAKVAPIQDLGQTARGHRRIIDILGGEVSGPRLSGEVLPGGPTGRSCGPTAPSRWWRVHHQEPHGRPDLRAE